MLHILASYADYSNIKFTVENGVWLVKAGGQMPDWKKHQLITEFRQAFKSCDVRLEGKGVNISGEATMRTSF